MELTQLEQIELQAEEIGFLREKYLRNAGWTHTCETPGSLWMWTREWSGKTLMADEATAWTMQQHIESRAELTDE